MDTPLDTNVFFSGGNGMFIQYHDIVKPVYLYAIMRMMIIDETFGLPFKIIKNFPLLSQLEWYTNRRYRNPLQQLDFKHSIDPSILDALMQKYLAQDYSIYKIAPLLPTMRMFDVYRMQRLQFPVFIYSSEYEENIRIDVENVFEGINHKYVYGNLKEALRQTENNFTYIFSDIECVKESTKILLGTCSNILVPRDYRYNFTDNFQHFKYDLHQLAYEHPFCRIETILAMDLRLMNNAFDNLIGGR